MARINDQLVIQKVGDRLVFIDDATGNETVISDFHGPRIVAMVAYLTDPDDPRSVITAAETQLRAVGALND